MKILKKLHSKTGASMLIALVFMMFCAFIGGAVLAAATANAGRIDALNIETQDYLDQRSICMLLVDELRSGDYNKMSMSIRDETLTPVTAKIVNNVPVFTENGTPQRTITITADENSSDINEMRLMLYKCAAMRYLKLNENGIDSGTNVVIQFGDDTMTKEELLKQFKANSESFDMKITDPLGNEINGMFKCSAAEENRYSLVIDFGDKTQMSIQMKATASEPDEHKIEPENDPNRKLIDKSQNLYSCTATVYSTTTIDWGTAYIEKGGLA